MRHHGRRRAHDMVSTSSACSGRPGLARGARARAANRVLRHRFSLLRLHSCRYQRGACPFATIVLLMIILLPMSFHNVEYDEMAFYKRRSTGTISRDKVYEAGRYFIGPDGEFVKFPASLQTVDFKGLSVWTKTQTTAEGGGQGAAGTAVKLDVSFQYRLRPAELSSLYSSVALTFRPFIENLATTTIKNISTSYTANEWTENRKEIQKAMLTGIDTALENAHADCGESAWTRWRTCSVCVCVCVCVCMCMCMCMCMCKGMCLCGRENERECECARARTSRWLCARCSERETPVTLHHLASPA